jgi:uncharacterized membrane protein YoaK (UPF0700 family)
MEGVIENIRDFITPIFLLIVGVVAMTFLFKRQTTQLIQFMLIATLVGMLLFSPEIISNFSTWVSDVFGG